MVYYFTSNVVTPPFTLFMGFDKYENEELIKWGWPEDVWFHVDKVSSAHVYLRLKTGQTIDDVPTAVLEDAAQLVKANSIQGNKMNDVDVLYTMWSNLKKTDSMEVGEVGFHKDKERHPVKLKVLTYGKAYRYVIGGGLDAVQEMLQKGLIRVRKIRVTKRSNEVINRLNKTKKEGHPDFRAEREQRDKEEREDKKKLLREQKEREKEEEARKKKEAELRSYSTLFKPENMTSNQSDGYDSDDFM